MSNFTSKNLDIEKLRKLAREIRDLTEKEHREEWSKQYDLTEIDSRGLGGEAQA